MTTERINEISNYLATDLTKTKELLVISPEEAASRLNAEGFSVSADELIAYGDILKESAAKTGELAESDLEQVAGGVGPCFWILVGVVGAALYAKW